MALYRFESSRREKVSQCFPDICSTKHAERPRASWQFWGCWMLFVVRAALAPPGAHAQITVTNSVFPVAGDRLFYAIDNNPGPQIVMGRPGLNQHWDFSSLQRSQSWSYTMRPASTGVYSSQFPDATLVYGQGGHTTIPNLPGSNGAEAYLKVANNQVQLLGFADGSDPLGIGVGTVTSFQPPQGLRRAPVNFFDASSNASTIVVNYPASSLPLQLPELTEYRYSGSLFANSIVDGAGTLDLPGGTFDVLRVKTDFYIEGRIEGSHPLLGWLDVTNQSIAYWPSALGVTRYYYHEFVDAQSKEVLATIEGPDNGGEAGLPSDPLAVVRVQFKDLNAPMTVTDFNGNGSLDAGDLDILAHYARDHNPAGDIDKDGDTDLDDRLAWIHTIRKSWVGDSNFDGEFNSADFVAVFADGKYETGQAATYSQGDWNGDGLFTSGDFVLAFSDGGYEKGPMLAVSVPEPVDFMWLFTAAPIAFRRRRELPAKGSR